MGSSMGTHRRHMRTRSGVRPRHRASVSAADPLERALRKLRGHVCWGAHWSKLLSLSMSIGPPRIHVSREPYESESKIEEVRRNASRRLTDVRGRWWLWVYLSYWRIVRSGITLASTCSSLQDKTAAFWDLSGQKVVDVEVAPRTGATRFVLDLDAVLEVRRCSQGTDKLWLLYEPSGYVLSVRADGMYDHEPGSGTDGRPKIIARPVCSRRRGSLR